MQVSLVWKCHKFFYATYLFFKSFSYIKNGFNCSENKSLFEILDLNKDFINFYYWHFFHISWLYFLKLWLVSWNQCSWTTLPAVKYKRFKKIAWIQSHHLHLQWKFKLLVGKFAWGVIIARHCQQTFCFQSLLTTPGNVLPLHLKQTFPPMFWIFTEGEGDEIKCRLSS